MKHIICSAAALLILVAASASSQRVDSKHSHYRVLAIDRTIEDDEGIRRPANHAGKLGYVAVYNFDTTLCLVEYVALKHQDHDALREYVARTDRDLRVQLFEKGKTQPAVFRVAALAAGFAPAAVDAFLEKTFVAVR